MDPLSRFHLHMVGTLLDHGSQTPIARSPSNCRFKPYRAPARDAVMLTPLPCLPHGRLEWGSIRNATSLLDYPSTKKTTQKVSPPIYHSPHSLSLQADCVLGGLTLTSARCLSGHVSVSIWHDISRERASYKSNLSVPEIRTPPLAFCFDGPPLYKLSDLPGPPYLTDLFHRSPIQPLA